MKPSAKPPWLRGMRRTDRQIVGSQDAWRILEKGSVCHVAFCAEGWPYVVPMNYGVLSERLYFHCARSGTKLDLLSTNPNVCFEVDTDVRIVPAARACDGATRYRSVIGFGQASIVTDPEERRAGLRALSTRYYNGEVTLPQEIPSTTVVLRIDVITLTAKESIEPGKTDRSRVAS
jgi:uncharacterized protein